MHKHRRIVLSITSLAILVVGILSLVNWRAPEELGPAGIAAFFLLVYLFIAQLVLLLLLLADYIRGSHEGVAAHLASSFGAALPIVMLLALNTIRNIAAVDILLSFVFGLILVFYLRRRT